MSRWEMDTGLRARLTAGEPGQAGTGVLSRSLVLSTVAAAEMREFYESLVFFHLSDRLGPAKGDVAACFRGPVPGRGGSRWLIHVAVDDLPSTLRRAELLRGRTVPLEAPGSFVVQAPDGSEIILSNSAGQDQTMHEMLELCTSNLPGSSAYYCGLLGLEAARLPDDPHNYMVFTDGGAPVAGAVDMTTFFATRSQAHWIPYFHVDELESTIAMAVDYGALVKVPLTMSNFSVRYAVLTDPQGASFGLREMPVGGVYGSWHQ